MAIKSIYQFGPEDRSKEGQAEGAIIYERLQLPLLKALYELGEDDFHSNEEMTTFLSSRLNLEDADIQKHGAGTELEYRIKWGLNNLKNSELIIKDSANYMSWKISKAGVDFLSRYQLINAESIEEDTIKKARKEVYAIRQDLKAEQNKVKRYWALGFGSEGWYDRLEDFKKNNYWQALDYGNDDDRSIAEKARELFMEIQPGDYAVIKGYGGRGDVNIHYMGEVVSIDPETNRIDFTKLDYPLYHGKAPKGHGAGNWFNTILEVTRKPDIDLLFYGKEPEKKEVDAGALFGENEPLNKILYGPPGTGKTFKLQTEYFDKFTTKQSAVSREQYFINKIQNFTWWEVIAAALLDLGKTKVADILVHPLVKLRAEVSSSSNIRPTLWGQLQAHTVEECKYVNVSRQLSPLIFNKTEDSFWELVGDLENEGPQVIELLEEFNNFKPEEGKVVKRYKFVTFHQSYSYEEFVEGIKPVMSKGEAVSKNLAYEIKDGKFKELCDIAKSDLKNPYALFIDEINRGNVSNIFGELITLIERDKRLGAKNELKAELAYSGDSFGVPPNLHIIGTMNTADRSVEALDTALRRRFTFEELLPNPDVIKSDGASQGVVEVEGKESIDLVDLLKTINKRIEVLIDRDHTIGHSFFMDVQSLSDLEDVFKDNIIPQLQEYFYGDYGKIGLVLGKGFVEKSKKENNLFAKFIYDGQEDLNQPTYKLVKFKGMDFYKAIQDLLGNTKEEDGE